MKTLVKLSKFSFSSKRIVVTGMGMVSSLGTNVEMSWDNMLSEKSGIIDLSKESYADLLPKNCKIGSPIHKQFDPTKYKTVVSKINN